MKVTEPAKQALNQILTDNQADGLQVVLQQSCCGVSPVFQLVRFDAEDRPDDIDGIQILIDDEAREAVSEVIIDLKDGELVVYNPVCGCGSGCSHDDHDHQCGSGCC